jgi:hypothetical protein
MDYLQAAGVLYAENETAQNTLCAFGKLDADGVLALDIDALSLARPDTAEQLRGFLSDSRVVLRSHREGVEDVPYAVVRRTLVSVAQSDTSSGRFDLTQQLRDGRLIPVLGDLLERICGASPDFQDVVRRSAAWKCAVSEEANMRVVTLEVGAAKGWTESWGGSFAENELRRIVTITVSHAPWRDRRVRRLVSVVVERDELWADPAKTSDIKVQTPVSLGPEGK